MSIQPSARSALGRVGLPVPMSELAGRDWDVVVVGGGHNGLTAAAYLARAGRSVLVLERRDNLGGACTLEQPFEDQRFLISPCAYLVGLLHPTVIAELDLPRYGFGVQVADPHLWCPFEDGTALALWNDAGRTAAAVAELAPGEVKGYQAYEALFGRIRAALRPVQGTDVWLGASPSRPEIEELLGDDEAVACLFEDSIADVIDRYVGDERLRTALHGQGVIGTFAGPKDPGTAGVHWMHASGRLQGEPGAWGYVQGGMGQVSFAIADAARELGATIASGVRVAAIESDEDGAAVLLDGGERIRAEAVVSNADPKGTLALLGDAAEPSFRARAESWVCESPVVKLNCALTRLPRFSAAAGSDPMTPYRAMVTISTGLDDTQAASEAARRGEVAPAWCELYFHSAYDQSIAPEGSHVMSVFAQYAPYQLAHGTWEERREEIGDAVLAAVARFAPDVADVVKHREVLGPPDVEARVGLSGGHIFQGECLPDQMWDRRWAPRLSVPGVYLCGAATHPGGSVIGANGRNAAFAVLEDLAAGRP